jgi:hypothetical protein
VEFAGASTWITSREGLILSNFLWGSDSGDTSPVIDLMVTERYKLEWLTFSPWICSALTVNHLD